MALNVKINILFFDLRFLMISNIDTVEIGSHSVVVGKKISEGGFANVFRAK